NNTFELRGEYLLVNTTASCIDSLLVHRPFYESCHFPEQQALTSIFQDDYSRYNLFILSAALQPGDSLYLRFEVQSPPPSILERQPKVKANGTFLRTNIFPRIGYRQTEITDPKLRRRYGLGSLDSLAAARQHRGRGHYQAPDSDWIEWEATLSTVGNQTALAPGELIRQWQNGKRRYFQYRSAAPIKFSIGLFSARYAVVIDTAGAIPVRLFYQQGHEYNLERLRAGVRQALEHNSTQFSPFSQHSLNLVEFPVTEGSFATLYGNLIPFSELYFLANVRPHSNDLDLPFYVAAHEMSHHWWGHQLLSAYGPGALMLTESLAEYAALEILDQAYGTEARRQFLEWDHRQYFQTRKSASDPELPLIQAKSGQEYVNYQKGALVMQALAARIGRPTFHALLADFLAQYRSSGAGYPTATAFLQFLKTCLPEVLHGYLDEQFQQIVTYTLRLDRVSCKPALPDQFLVAIAGQAQKELQGEASPLEHPFEVCIYGEDEKLLLKDTLQSSSIGWSQRYELGQRAVRIVLDPDCHFLDPNRSDNTARF
ncbi:MAG: hypothetical protein KDC44_16710, partial [Phaeodactylibacter sp.]|nr:hypothetical protein [Phaeodactylibacter sp.]